MLERGAGHFGFDVGEEVCGLTVKQLVLSGVEVRVLAGHSSSSTSGFSWSCSVHRGAVVWEQGVFLSLKGYYNASALSDVLHHRGLQEL